MRRRSSSSCSSCVWAWTRSLSHALVALLALSVPAGPCPVAGQGQGGGIAAGPIVGVGPSSYLSDAIVCAPRFQRCPGLTYSNPAAATNAGAMDLLDRYNAFVDRCNFSPDAAFRERFKLGRRPLLTTELDPVACSDTLRPGGVLLANSTLTLTYNLTRGPGGIGALYAVMDACVRAYARLSPPPSSLFANRLLVLANFPDQTPWAGVALNRCGLGLGVGARAPSQANPCYVALNNRVAGAMTALAHEVGHTLGLSHGASASWDLGDCSCPMGCADTLATCFAAPYARQLGWATHVPGGALDLRQPPARLPRSTWRSFTLPVYASAFENHVVVSPIEREDGGAGSPAPSYAYAVVQSIVVSRRGLSQDAPADQGQGWRWRGDQDLKPVVDVNGTLAPVDGTLSVHVTLFRGELLGTQAVIVGTVREGDTLWLDAALFARLLPTRALADIRSALPLVVGVHHQRRLADGTGSVVRICVSPANATSPRACV